METAVRWPVRSASRAASVTTAAAKPSQEVGPVDVPGRHRVQPFLQFGVVGADEPVPPVHRDAAAVPVLRPHGYLADVGQRDGAGLADDLAADVVAVPGADEELVVDERAAGHLQHQDQRILQALGGVAAAARRQHAGRHDLLAEQPADDVDLVHGRVADDHVGGEAVVRHRGVAVRAVHQQRRAEAAVLQRGLHGPVAGVVTAHEADLDQPAPGRHLGVHDPLAGGAGRRERLLAEHRLARGDRRDDLFLVGRAPGRDQHRVDVAVRDQVLGGGVSNRARQARRDLPGARRVDVVDGRDRPAGEHLGDPADVVLADHPHSDDADADAHGYSCSPMPTPRR